MHISNLTIKNFRGISHISTEFGRFVNVLVGPNGVGKTTILQAIRLAKCIAAPRSQNETNQVLISLGAVSPHFPQRINLAALANDVAIPIEIISTYEITDAELQEIRQNTEEIVRIIVASQIGRNFSNPAEIAQFMHSRQGQDNSKELTINLEKFLNNLDISKYLQIGISVGNAGIKIYDTFAGNILAYLDQKLPPSKTIFSYFPADRALPTGEVNLQLGGPDMQQQLESHNSQPQLKYNRLKNIIINSLFMGPQFPAYPTIRTAKEEFETIFSDLLRGKTIESINVNEIGLLAVITKDHETGKLIELDALSSGEKNIALTYLILGQSLANGGIALFDEPELHLNSSVSKDLLRFTLEQYAKPMSIQIIMCSHSPEILSGAFSNSECRLLHLKSSVDITRVGRDSISEYSSAVEKLGATVSEGLLYEGTIFVEGPSDVQFLELAFPDFLRKFKIKARGGRREIEKTIKELQSLELAGQTVAPIYLIFDKDDEFTDLENSNYVRIHQWKRRCLENYMLDSTVIADIMSSDRYTKLQVESEGWISNKIKSLAFDQINALAARSTYMSFQYLNASLTKIDLANNDINFIAESLFGRMDAARGSLPSDDKAAWTKKFLANAEIKKMEMTHLWEARWKELCDGKALIEALYRTSDMKVSIGVFKELIVQRMRDSQSEDWRLVKSALTDLLAKSTP